MRDDTFLEGYVDAESRRVVYPHALIRREMLLRKEHVDAANFVKEFTCTYVDL